MDLKLIASTFLAIFLAELGDKTQLVVLSLAAGGKSKWHVFIGAATALVLASAIAVVLGAGLDRFLPEWWIKRGAGVVFVLLGLLFLSGKLCAQPHRRYVKLRASRPIQPQDILDGQTLSTIGARSANLTVPSRASCSWPHSCQSKPQV